MTKNNFSVMCSLLLILALLKWGDAFGQDSLLLSEHFDDSSLQLPWVRWQSTKQTAFIENSVLNIKTNNSWQVVQRPLQEFDNGNYLITFVAKSEKNSRLRILIEDNKSKEILYSKVVSLDQQWESFSEYFQVNSLQSSPVLRIFPQDRLEVEGEVSIDSISVEKVDKIAIEQPYIFADRFDSSKLNSRWERWQSTESTAYIKNNSLQINTNDSWQVVQTKLNFDRLGQYEISFEAKTNENTRMRVMVEDFTSGEVLSEIIIGSNEPWRNYNLYLDVKNKFERLYFRIFPLDRKNENGVIYFDNFNIIKKDSLIGNAGFDKSKYDLSPWMRWQSSEATANAENNVLSIKTSNSWQVVQQNIVYPEVNKKYQVSFLAKTNPETSLRASIYDFTEGVTLGSLTIGKGEEWKRFHFNFTSPSELGNTVALRFYPQDREALNGVVYVDDVSITKEKNISLDFGVIYDAHDGYFSYKDTKIKGVNEYSISKDQKYFVYTKAVKGKSFELFKVNQLNGEEERVTFTDSLVFSPAVDEHGNFAHLESSNSVSSSKVFINNTNIPNQPLGLNRHLNIVGEKLYFTNSDYQSNRHTLAIYDLNLKSLETIHLPGIPQKMKPLGEDKLVIQLHGDANNKLSVYSFDINTRNLTLLSNPELSSFFSVEENGHLIVQELSGDTNLKLFFYSTNLYKYSQIGEPFSIGDNKLGRLSWNQSYRLTGLVDIFRVTRSDFFLSQVENTINNLLSVTNQHQGFVPFGQAPHLWATTKYSIDKSSPINLLIDDATILHAMLYAVRYMPIEPATRAKVIELAASAYDYYDNEFDGEHYRIAYGIPYALDGLWAPNNFQNKYGLSLLYLYQLTNEERYFNRLKLLATRFLNEVNFTNDGRVLWQYWPAYFYNGWSESSGISKNLPSRAPTVSTLYEDIAHAAVSVDFLIKLIEYTDIVNDESLFISRLENTVEGFSFGDSYSRFISGDIDYQPASELFTPLEGWAQMKHQKILSSYINYIPMYYPYFDSMSRVSDYINAIDLSSMRDSAKLEVVSNFYDVNLNVVKTESSAHFSPEDILISLGIE
ncbi:hypothetical protein CWB99_12155 [Pseudoalteromonas rubra]|uniref:Uncharacterized protein n=1 Tax=Pseudoalteromonas rubra TaxID=43658 RepID=A0A5S3WKK8_9GAMM|nr:carbohydrate binding domain-containing protein [Pseudoalteromonas rubra]TMP28157.1 hypothetical protein CWB99_12155 [Pseudoalteromonas rubra]TMP34858.1 hypothetical protein CWC00_05785 [Pseudoalteromonas rubra]